MAGYKARLERDLDRWIAKGLTPAESREAILASVTEGPRVDASTALAVVGALLAAVAAVAFVAANWDAIPRLGRFALILSVFLAAAAGAAWAGRLRPILANTLLAVAAIIYASAIGLTGQIFDIAGDPQTALRAGGLAAGLLALGGRSSGAAIVSLALLGFGEFADASFQGVAPQHSFRWLVFAAAAGLALAWLWNSRPLAHAASLALIIGVITFIAVPNRHAVGLIFIGAGFGLATLAAAARWISPQRTASVVMLWSVWGALLLFAVGGFDDLEAGKIVHRAAWVVASGGTIALGMHDRQGMITAAGVVSMIAAVGAVLFDLGLGLMTSAGLLAACAVAALVVGLVVRRRRASA
jgi:uncharacterized membrane protein